LSNAIPSSANLLQGIKSGLEASGFRPEIKDLDFFQDDYGLKPAAGEQQDSEEEEVDEEGEDGEEENDIEDGDVEDA
jgi:hypothetical protein